MKSALFALVLAVALPASAAFGDRYPAGSIQDRARAEQALRDADAEEARIVADSAAREAECFRRFLVNRCREEVRRDRLAADRDVVRVRAEAREVQRRLDAADAAQRRAEAAERADRPPAPGSPPPPSRSRAIAPDEAARNRAEFERRQAEHKAAAANDRAERSRNVQAYEDRQAEAARRAKEKEEARLRNEARRAERRKQLEDREAQREAVRRRAEEAARAATKP